VSTNYWETDHARAGYFYLSSNAGTFRLLVPASRGAEIQEWLTATLVLISRGPWPQVGKADGLEILFEDESNNPYALHLTTDSVDRMPLDTDRDRPGAPPRWTLSVWTREGKILELPARYRRVPRIPWLKPWPA